MFSIYQIAFTFLCFFASYAGSVSAQAPTGKSDLQLSTGVIELLRAEMRALLTGIQSLPAAIVTADWKTVADTSKILRGSYLLEQKLTPGQRKELSTSLPEHFKRLDADFHLEAGKLEAAALNHDAQLSSFHFYRLIETCTACHTLYAPTRFPNFAASKKRTHEH